MCALSFVPRTPPKRHRFRPRCRLWRPNICTFIHLCSRPKPFELVELGRVMCSNYHRRHWDYKLILGCYHLVPRTIYENTVYMYEYTGIWYVQVPEVHLQNTCEYMNAYLRFVTYVLRTSVNICIYLSWLLLLQLLLSSP